jgi:G3E family GTPase
VAETFTFADESGQSLSDVARLDTMVTVVDVQFPARLRLAGQPADARRIARRRGHAHGRRSADRAGRVRDAIVLNKVDLIDDAGLERLTAILRRLNPRARIEVAEFGRVPLDRVLDTRLFDFEEASKAPGWLRSCAASTRRKPRNTASPVSCGARRPLHPQRVSGR